MIVLLLLPGSALADQASRLRELSQALDSCRRLEAPVFSPAAWDEAQKNYSRARMLHEQGEKTSEVEQKIELGLQKAQEAAKTAESVRDHLSASLPPRSKARAARAQFIVPREYSRAEDLLTAAARKVESGNVEGGQSEARKAEPWFDAAELSAIHRSVLHRSDSLLDAAEVARSARFAPATLGQAQAHRTRAYDQIVADRTDTARAWTEARQAEAQALHALALGRYIQQLETARTTPEQMVLEFESELVRLSAAAGVAAPSLGGGPVAAVDSLAAALTGLQTDIGMAGSELSEVATVLGKALAETGESSPSAHPVELATQAAERLARLTEEKADWARMAQARQAQLAEVSQMADESAYELSRRKEREEKFKAAANLLTVSEGTVLYNDHDDIVLRLTGLSFDPGQSELSAAHEKILAKVQTILESFAGHPVVVEGHTDARGNPSGNLTLSEKRAESVRSWLAKRLKRESATLEAKGYGDKSPVASNSTSDGRAKNRRIDVLISK